MKKLVFIAIIIFMAIIESGNVNADTYTSSTQAMMSDATFQWKAENLVGNYPTAIAWETPICSESEYNISKEITSSDILRIQNCWKKIATKIISLNTLWITNTNNYRKQERNNWLKSAFDRRVTNFQQIKRNLLAYQALSDSYLYFNFKPLLKEVKDNTAYNQYSTLINANETVSWSFDNINKHLKDFQIEKMKLYYAQEYSIPPTNTKIWINEWIDLSWSLVPIKNDAVNAINNLYTKLYNYHTNNWLMTWEGNWLLFKDLSDFKDYLSYLSWSVSNSLDIQISELNTAVKYRILSEQLYPSNEALLFLIRQLYIIQTNVNDNWKNLTYLNQPIILKEIKKGIMSWFRPTITFYPNKEKEFSISSSTYEATPNLTNNKKKVLGDFIQNNLLFNLSGSTSDPKMDSNRKDTFVFKGTGINTLTSKITANTNAVATINWYENVDNIGSYIWAVTLWNTYNYIRWISKSFTKVGSIYTANDL